MIRTDQGEPVLSDISNSEIVARTEMWCASCNGCRVKKGSSNCGRDIGKAVRGPAV
jgi:hypothetical protein